MVKIMIKGGIWKNTEDEILKAAVMKYGKNQWSRIASLLHRKSNKQCKSRWFEWLDPSIKKTEWSREEEEKLLHLAKLFPTQWRTIAPIIGRTAAQCLDHYEKLLDQAQSGAGYDPRNDPRRLRPGEIDPNPHTKPARPDQVDMDEDEKEMLSEARARLANTQGKKAKRKAREKTLEEARRLASLQKKRELRAAGIDVFGGKKRKRGVDYNAEIPFEKKAPAGFFDPGKDAVAHLNKEFKKGTLEDADGGEQRDATEKRLRKEDKKKHEAQQKKDMPRAVLQMNKMGNEEITRKRSKLVLPKPMTTDGELEELVKMGQSAEAAMAAAGGEEGANLLQDYSSTPANSLVARTPKAAATADPLLYEAKNIIALNQTASVLEGGENTPLHQNGGSFQGVTPSREAMATPNTVLTTPFRGASVGGTPGMDANALAATPLRDTLGINSESDSSLLTPRTRNEQARQSAVRSDLRAGLASLPKAAGDYEVVAPELPEEEGVDADGMVVEDAADVDTRSAADKAAAAAEDLKRRSQAIQRKLPIPRGVKSELLLRANDATTAEQAADELVKHEMLALMKFDEDETTKQPDSYEDDEISAAKEALAVEMEALREQLGDADLNDKYLAAMDAAQDEVMYVPSKKKFGRASVASKDDKLKLLESQLESTINAMKKDLKKTLKLEKKQKKLTTGYAMRGAKQSKTIKSLNLQISEARFQLAAYEKLQEREKTVIPTRKAHLQGLVDVQEEREAELQTRYAALQEERNVAHAQLQAKKAVATAVSAAPTTV